MAVDTAADATEDVTEEGGSCLVGGSSFTAKTEVLLANGKAAPISSLTVGEKVLATNTKTGKTEAEAVTAVMLHYDRDLYDLKVRARGKTTVIDTTSSHLFWVPGGRGQSGRWVKAGALKYGAHLRTATGNAAVVVGGAAPRQQDGWMWDITVPGDNDHDFYVRTASTGVLVHNCGEGVSGTASALKGVFAGAFQPRQLLIGAAGGGVGNFVDAYEDGERGGKLWGTAALGAATGAISNIQVGKGLGPSLFMGGLAGDLNGTGSQLIDNGWNIRKVNYGWVAVDTGIGVWGNAVGTEIQGADEDPTLGNSMRLIHAHCSLC